MDIYYPDDQEIQIGAELLVNKFGVSAQLLGQLLGKTQRDKANVLLQKLGKKRLDRIDVARLLVLRKGSELFGGSTPAVRTLRQELLGKLSEEKIRQLYRYHKVNGTISIPSRMRKPLAEMKWVANGRWPRTFVTALGFPGIFAGVRQKETKPTFRDVEPFPKPPALEPFQSELKEKMIEVLRRDAQKTRCMVSLPTGGGKTRVAVEAFVDWMRERFVLGEYLVWIAQSEELCEQAMACIEQIWASLEYPRALRVYRDFGSRDIPLAELRGGAVVASIQQLYKRIRANDPVSTTILRHTGALIIDEAHHATSQMYTTLLDKGSEVTDGTLFPICGLSATPGRAGADAEEETQLLADRFEWYLVTPDLGSGYEQNPLQFFVDKAYLAKARHIVVRSGREYELTDEELTQMRTDPDLPAGFLKRLAQDDVRNERIVRRLGRIPDGKPTLVYACTVDHAHFLAMILESSIDRRAGALSADTPLTIRRGLIEQFRRGEIQYLFNFGVLTTGFDAPKTECIVITRPTTSTILYEQIVGRGLRGTKFGGTEYCDVIDFADNIRRLGPPLSYTRFQDRWVSDTEEE